MKDWKKILVSSNTTIRETIRVMDSGALKIALVVDEKRHLLGTVSDGDVRRGILKGYALEDQVNRIMNTAPTSVYRNESRDTVISLMRTKQIYQIPVLDEDGTLAGLEVIDNVLAAPQYDNWVVLMAGGLGTRLKQLTKNTPKPLLRVGDKPILETILENFIEQGFKHIFISVNYKSQLIEEYFGNGARWGVKIKYIREDRKLGTAGALGLLPHKPNKPLLVMNGDILSKINFQQLLDFHQHHSAIATMCVREYDMQIPYGVVTLDTYKISSIEEKPIHRFFVNAGIYVLEPETLEMIPRNSYLDMPSLFRAFAAQKLDTVAFPIREYWLDIGRLDDFERAQGDFSMVFE